MYSVFCDVKKGGKIVLCKRLVRMEAAFVHEVGRLFVELDNAATKAERERVRTDGTVDEAQPKTRIALEKSGCGERPSSRSGSATSAHHPAALQY